MAASPTTFDELTQFVCNVIIQQFGEEALVNVDKLKKHFPEYDLLKTALPEVKSEVETVTAQLDQSFPELVKLLAQAKAASQTLSSSVSGLETRDREISEKLNVTFAKIDAQIESVQLQASAVETIGPDMLKLRNDVQSYVSNAFASLQQRNQDGGGTPHEVRARQGSKLNNPSKSEVSELTDGLTRAQFVLWRDNLDLHLEEFPDFGIGTDHVLKLVRLHPNIVQVSDLKKFKN